MGTPSGHGSPRQARRDTSATCGVLTAARTLMRSTPTLTIGLPVFNGARFVQETIDSVLAQTFTDFELLISDNASTDETEAIARSAADGDGRITYRRNEVNVGLARNLNLLVPLATGRLFKWAAADDVLRPTYLERCVATIDADP